MTVQDIERAGDVLSFTVVIGALAQVLPSIASLFTVVWMAIRIVETDTVQRLLGRKKD